MVRNVFESIRDIGENLLDWEPQIPRPDVNAPIEDVREYRKKVSSAKGDFFLTNAYRLDQEIDEVTDEPVEYIAPSTPLSTEATDNVVSIAAARRAAIEAIKAGEQEREKAA